MPYSIEKERRQQAILSALPRADSQKRGKNAGELLSELANDFAQLQSEQGRRRAIQRDLQELLRNEQICVDEAIQAIGNLPASQFISLADTIRLTPIQQPDPSVQAEIVKALRNAKVLRASYRKPWAEEEQLRYLSVLGILQRGSRFYVVAYDYDHERGDLPDASAPAKMFLLNRFVDALALDELPSKLPIQASLARQVSEPGWVDFGDNLHPITLKLRLFGYVIELLKENQLTPQQILLEEKDAAGNPVHPKAAMLTATLPWTATLVRWLLGFGHRVEVLEPLELREEMLEQLHMTQQLYTSQS